MDNRQQENRRRAARKFMRSLTELEAVLQADDSSPEPTGGTQATQASSPSEAFDWETALGEAAQDIEQFMADPTPDAEGSSGP
ncbi:MAG: hypothetical protein ACFB0C_13770 [Leptolyngbyaceae cyanobacterium]